MSFRRDRRMSASITGCDPSALFCVNCFCATKEGAELAFPLATESTTFLWKAKQFCAEGGAQKKEKSETPLHTCGVRVCLDYTWLSLIVQQFQKIVLTELSGVTA